MCAFSSHVLCCAVQVVINNKTFRYSATLIQYTSTGAGVCCVRAQGQQHDVPRRSSLVIVEGPVVQEVREVYDTLGTVVTRLWKDSDSLEVEWTVSTAEFKNKDAEVLLRYETDVLADGGVFYTDANGREWQQRKTGYRPSYSLAPPALIMRANLYPATTGFGIAQGHRSIFVATDRAQAVTSLHSGQLDVLVHRTTAASDGSGLNEALNDLSIVVGKHIVSFGGTKPLQQQQQQSKKKSSKKAQDQQRQQQSSSSTGGGGEWRPLDTLTTRHHQQILNDPLVLAFSAVPARQYRSRSSALPLAQVPAAAAAAEDGGSPLSQVSITTMKWLSCDLVLLRISHLFQPGEHPVYSQPAVIRLDQLLNRTILDIQEATLFGERELSKADLIPGSASAEQFHAASWDGIWEVSTKLTKWDPALLLPEASDRATAGAGQFLGSRLPGMLKPSQAITIQPMQIRTFFVTLHRQHSTCTIMPDSGMFFSSLQAAARETAIALYTLPDMVGIDGDGIPVLQKPKGAEMVLEGGTLLLKKRRGGRGVISRRSSASSSDEEESFEEEHDATECLVANTPMNRVMMLALLVGAAVAVGMVARQVVANSRRPSSVAGKLL